LSLNAKLLLLISLSITASVGMVAFLIEEQAHEAFRRIEKERTETLVGQFRSEFNHEGVEITSSVEGIANSDAMLRTASELTNGADLGGFINEAAGYATTAHLDFLDLIAPDGTIVSSAHWPARFGYKQRWFLDAGVPVPDGAFLRHVETPQGTALAMLCIRPVKTHSANYYLIGGRKLEVVLQALSAPPGLRFSIYSAPEKGPGELLGGTKSNIGLDKVMPLIQKAMDEHREQATTVDWGTAVEEEIMQAIPLPGYADRVPGVLLVGNSLEQELALEKRIRNISLTIAGAAVLLGVIFSAVFAARINRPVKKLARAAAEIGQGNWDVRVETGSKDEIGKLAAAFNQMTEELIAQRERLVQTERVAAWRELARRLAHELKNPLFPLQITVENLLRARENAPDEFEEIFRESTTTLLAEIANLKTIIGRFSDFSRMPAPELQATDLDALVRSVVQLFQGQLTSGAKKIEPVLELEKLPPVSADPVLIRRVIENLVLNAIDAMPNGGTLTFRTALDDRFAVVEIADTGTGLTPEECDRIFTPYYTSKQHGTGLGLAIAQSVVSDHHGRISVSSTKNLGTTFRVELPLYSANGSGAL